MSSNLRTGLISIVVPVYNEAAGLQAFHSSLIDVISTITKQFEIIYCDDGSTDQTASTVQMLHQQDSRVKLVSLSRNFGKENALTAGISVASGRAVVTLDGDGQHPIKLIPAFIEKWQTGSKVIVGVRTNPSSRGWLRRFATKSFYTLFNHLSKSRLIPGSSDFRLLDKRVVEAFLRLRETDRMTRQLVDWLGFEPVYIHFKAPGRQYGNAVYTKRKLAYLAMHSVVAASPTPLYVFGFVGVGITIASFIVGLAVLIEQLLLGDPWRWKFTGTAMLSILLLFLVGVILISQGLLSLYVSSIHNQSKQRPLYIIDEEKSVGISANA